MHYLEALFKDISNKSNKTNKIRRQAWKIETWIEEGEHGKMHRIMKSRDNWEVYQPDIEMLEDDWEVCYYAENKSLFTAVFERYEQITGLFQRKIHFRDVRTREGAVVTRKLVFDEETSSRIVGHLTFGEYIAFLADVEFKNIEFQYPHSLQEV